MTSHLVHWFPFLRSGGKGDVSIICCFHSELDLPGRHGIEMVFQFVLGGKRCNVDNYTLASEHYVTR